MTGTHWGADLLTMWLVASCVEFCGSGLGLGRGREIGYEPNFRLWRICDIRGWGWKEFEQLTAD